MVSLPIDENILDCIVPKLLFFANTTSQWSVILPLLPKLEKFQIELLVGSSVASKVSAERYVQHPTFTEGPEAPKLSFYHHRYLTTIFRDFNYQRYTYFRSAFREKLNYYLNLLQESQFSAVVVGEDGVGGEIWLIRAAKKLGIPVVILPYEASGKEDHVNNLRLKKKESNLVTFNDRQESFLRSIGVGNWITEFEGEMAGMFLVEYITALNDMGCDLSNPWTTHGGEADLLLSESIGMTSFYKDEGLAPEKIRETGSPYDDAIHAPLMSDEDCRRSYEECTKINKTGTSVLVSLPPDYDSERGHLSQFSSYFAMRDTMIEELGRGVSKLTIMVHPAYHDQARASEDSKMASFSKGWVLDQIPLHDVYVTCGSSTLRWAVAARKVAIDLDVYKLRLKFFDRLPGLKKFEESTDCFNFVKTLTNEDSRFHEHIISNADATKDWAFMDGGCRDRIAAVLGDIT